MQIEVGDIFKSRIEAVVNPVNTVGVMGAGLAKGFKQRYPGMFQSYKHCCDSGILTIGTIHPYHIDLEDNPQWIINFPTKRHWKDLSRIEYINDSLSATSSFVKPLGISSIVFPAVGCGLGGLSIVVVAKLLQIFDKENENLDVWLYVSKEYYSILKSTGSWLNKENFVEPF